MEELLAIDFFCELILQCFLAKPRSSRRLGSKNKQDLPTTLTKILREYQSSDTVIRSFGCLGLATSIRDANPQQFAEVRVKSDQALGSERFHLQRTIEIDWAGRLGIIEDAKRPTNPNTTPNHNMCRNDSIVKQFGMECADSLFDNLQTNKEI